MSLLSEAMEDFNMIDKTSAPDGYGGTQTVWVPGAPFKAAAVLDSSMQARIAEKEGVTAVYTITTSRNVNLQYHDVIKRVSDGKIFRVKSDGDDVKTPNSAGLDMRQVNAEEWTLPNK